jgi:hypothetical protein
LERWIVGNFEFERHISYHDMTVTVLSSRNVLEEAGYTMRTDEDGEVQVVLPVPPREEEPDDDEDDFFYDEAAPFGIADENPAIGAIDLVDDNDDYDQEFGDEEDWS